MKDTPARPTFLCHAYAAWKLIQSGKVKAAEDELAAGFGMTVTRVEREGRLIAKWMLPTDLTPEEELHAVQQMQDIVARLKQEFEQAGAPITQEQETKR